jgi:hypothetical protein
VTTILPSTPLFLFMYVRKEALLSSQIEGTQSSLSDLLLFENDEIPRRGRGLKLRCSDGAWAEAIAGGISTLASLDPGDACDPASLGQGRQQAARGVPAITKLDRRSAPGDGRD